MSDLTQYECDCLFKLNKEFEDNQTIELSPPPLQWVRKIKSTTTGDTFLLDFWRGSFRLQKYTFNHRCRQSIILLRFDNHGEHTNPDGIKITGPHVHIYREGFGDKYAFPVSEINIKQGDTMDDVLREILLYCNIKLIGIQTPML